ncbi:PD-(D/E)XK nuclease-like domain-containing protein [Polaromonas aquatica]|uniref:PD-(D/E)XK nuclease-like domain-containing protein n=1 Tax=Polaromonas aquatica TaxID=332657 RepID=A0ABW1TUE7_9BURK
MLKPLLESPAHFQANLLSLNKATKAMDFGSLVHGLVLEPHLIGNEFSIYPGIADGRASEYKAFLTKHASRMVVDEPTFARARRLAEKILHRIVFGRAFGDFVNEGTPEASIYVEEPTTGLMLRTRLDLYHPEHSFDLKTTRHGTINAFIRDAVDMHYDFQAFMYTIARSLYEGRSTPAKFVFIAAETEAPNSIHQITAGQSFMSNGAKKFQEVLSVYSACMQTGFWPDSSGNAEAEIEPWQSFSGKSDWKAALGGYQLSTVH